MDLFQMSLTASPLIAIILLCRLLLLHQLPKKTFKILWLFALWLLLIPHVLPSPFSIYNLFPVKQVSPLSVSYAPDTALPSVTLSAYTNDTISLLEIFWLTGCIAIAVYFLRTHIQNRMKFIDSDKQEHQNLTLWFQENTIRRPMRIRFSHQISNPLTYGVFMPVILLPKSTDLDNEPQLRYILTHEYIHLCNFDALLKIVLAIALCLHWFNPLVWIMFLTANRDIELSCDEGVIHTLGYDKKEAYAFLLINMSSSHSSSPSGINHFTNNALKERIIALLQMKKKHTLRAFIATILSLLIFLVFATTAVPDSPKEFDPETDESVHLQYLYDIQTYYKNINKSNYLLSELDITAADLSYQNLYNYEQAIPKLIQQGKVSENIALHNLNRLKKMLAGEHTNFYSFTPRVTPVNVNILNSSICYRVELDNGDVENEFHHYYSVNIWIIN